MSVSMLFDDYWKAKVQHGDCRNLDFGRSRPD